MLPKRFESQNFTTNFGWFFEVFPFQIHFEYPQNLIKTSQGIRITGHQKKQIISTSQHLTQNNASKKKNKLHVLMFQFDKKTPPKKTANSPPFQRRHRSNQPVSEAAELACCSLHLGAFSNASRLRLVKGGSKNPAKNRVFLWKVVRLVVWKGLVFFKISEQ